MKWILGLLCLFFLILFHEFGHFLAAKLFGVKVESFSVGMGPVLLHRTIKGTDYRLSLIPLGGYCGMKGEKDFQKAIEEKLTEIPGDKDSFYGVHPLKRALIGFAGPFFNFIFAFLCYAVISGIGYTYYTYSNKIIIPDETQSTCQVAKEAGLLTGDKIIKINGKTISDFSEIIEEVTPRPDEDITVTVDRNGDFITVKLHTELNKSTGAGRIGIMADNSPDSILEKHTPHYNFFTAIGHGFTEAIDSVGLTIKSLGILFKGIEIQNAVSGPGRVTEMLGSTVQQGFKAGFKVGLISLLSLMAIISISLFIMNLLPIPILDGGIILLALIQIIIRRKLNPKFQYYIQFIGVAFIIMIFLIAVTGDINFFMHRGGK